MTPERRRALTRIVRTSSRFPLKRARSRGACLELARRAGGQRPPGSERDLAERAARAAGPTRMAGWSMGCYPCRQARRHPARSASIKSHGAQFFTGMDLERRSTLPAGHRPASRARGGHARNEVYSWYLRLWPGRGTISCMAAADRGLAPTAARFATATDHERLAPAERAPLATRIPRWDRLYILYMTWRPT